MQRARVQPRPVLGVRVVGGLDDGALAQGGGRAHGVSARGGALRLTGDPGRSDGQGVRVEGGLSSGADLLVDVWAGLGGVHGGLDAHAVLVELSRADLGDVLRAVDLPVLLTVLVVLVGAQGELGVAHYAAEAARVEEGEVLQGPDLVGRVDRLAAAEAGHGVQGGLRGAEHVGGLHQNLLGGGAAALRVLLLLLLLLELQLGYGVAYSSSSSSNNFSYRLESSSCCSRFQRFSVAEATVDAL